MLKELQRVAIWDITSKCNLRCKHCYNEERYWDSKDKYPELSKNDIKSIIDKLKELNFTRIHLLGGEPLLAKNLLYIVSYARKNDLEVTMVTNGTLLEGNLFRKLCEFGVSTINISLDGSNAEENDIIRGKGVFDKIISNIKDANNIRVELKSEILLNFSFTLTKKSLANSYNLPSLANENSIDAVTVSYISNEGKAREEFTSLDVTEKEKFDFLDKLIEDYKKNDNIGLFIDARGWLIKYIYNKHGVLFESSEYGCKGGDEQLYILADATMLPCSPSDTSMGDFLNKEFETNYPNLLENTIDEILSSKGLINFHNYTRCKETYLNISPCNECDFTCRACPLLYHKNNKVLECFYAKKELDELDKKELITFYDKSKHIRLLTIHDEVKILDFLTQSEYVLEGVGTEIWNLINSNNSIKDIIDNIYNNYDSSIPYNEIKKDVLDLIYNLKSNKLITISNYSL